MNLLPQRAVDKIIASVLLFFVLCAPAFAAQSARSDFEERRRAVAAAMEEATVWIVAEDDQRIAYGSGFIVADGYIITNAHVLEDIGKGGTVYVLNERIPARKARITAVGHDSPKGGQAGGRDFALLRFTPPEGEPLPVLTLTVDIKRMDRVSAWGYPAMATQFDVTTERLQRGDTRGLRPPPVVYTEGSVNAIVRTKFDEAILHSAQISSGNSGGPLVNGRGEVVGVNTWSYREEDEGAFLNGAQPAQALARFLLENGVTPKLAAGQHMPPPRSAAGRADGPKTPAKTPPEQPEQDNRLRDAGSFSVQVPPGWSVMEEETDSILIGSDDHESVVGIMVVANKRKTLRQIAVALAEKFGGGEPDLDDEVYTFTFVDKGVDAIAVVSEADEEGRFVVIMLFGDTQKPGMQEILDSVEDK